MLYIKLKPRAYRVREIIVTRGGFPATHHQLQCLTRVGWNTIHLFESQMDAIQALKEWKETLA